MESDADIFGMLGHRQGAEGSIDGVLQRVVDAVLVQVDAAEHTGVLILSTQAASTPAASADVVRELDREQYAVGEGPGFRQRSASDLIVSVADFASDGRWPRFSAAAVGQGVRSMLSFPLYSDATTTATLNVYAGSAGAFSDDSVHMGKLLAVHAANAVAAQTRSRNLGLAFTSRDTIAQAKGILMQRYQISAAQALDLLIAASQLTHLKIQDIAQKLNETGKFGIDK